MERTILIDGKEVPMKCTGGTPRVYRDFFGRDLFTEFTTLGKAMKNGEISDKADFSIVENLAYTMAYQADRTIGKQADWLDQFDHASAIMDAMQDILAMWTDSLRTISEAKKKTDRPTDLSR